MMYDNWYMHLGADGEPFVEEAERLTAAVLIDWTEPQDIQVDE